jgi:outer membrane protein
MPQPTPSLRLIYLAAIVCCIVASLTGARAEQDKNPGGLKVAVVNQHRLGDDYKYAQKTLQDLQKKEADFLTMLQTWQQNNLLSEADQKALSDLNVKDANTLSADEKARKQKLLDQSKRLFDELLALQTRPQLNVAENDRLKEFSRLQADTEKRIKDRQGELQQQEQQDVGRLRDKVLADTNAGIAKVAKEKGYNLVFSSDVVLYADNDITDQVLKEINK